VRALVLAQGNGWRWDNYLGGPKQLVCVVDGEPVLHRTVRLLAEHGIEPVVVGPDESFAVDGALLVTLERPAPTGCDQDKFFATRRLWAPDDRTVLLWGDCFYTEQAMATIVDGADGVHYYRRPGPSAITGHEWDESFAVSFWPHDHDSVCASAARVFQGWCDGLLHTTHIRTHYAATLGFADDDLDDPDLLVDTPGQTIIDDETDDFDYPRDYERWLARCR